MKKNENAPTHGLYTPKKREKINNLSTSVGSPTHRKILRKMTLWFLVFFSFGLLTLTGIGCQAGVSGNSESEPGDTHAKVFTSFYPIQALTQEVAGDALQIQSFVPEGKDPHMWSPTPKDMKRLAQADMLIINGANLEPWLEEVTAALPDLKIVNLSDDVKLITYKGQAALGDFRYMGQMDLEAGKTYTIAFGHTHEKSIRVSFQPAEGAFGEVTIAAAKKVMNRTGVVTSQQSTIEVDPDQVYSLEMAHLSGMIHFRVPHTGKWNFVSDRISEDILPYRLVDAHKQDLAVQDLVNTSTSASDKISYDPHSWLSPLNAKAYALSIEAALSQQYPEFQRTFRLRKGALAQAFTDLYYTYKERLQDLPFRDFVVTHHAYAYLARDWDLNQYALQGLISTASPSLSTIKHAMEFIRNSDVKTIFYEQGMQAKGAEILAEEIPGGKALPLISMEYGPVQGADGPLSFVQVLERNAENLSLALEEVNFKAKK